VEHFLAPPSSKCATCFEPGATAAANGVGRLTGIADQGGSTGFIYNPLDQITLNHRVIGSNAFDMAYSYDPAGNILTETYPLGPHRYLNGNNALGRTLLRIHGDNAAHNHTASTGCIIEGPNVRNRIANSNDNCLKVVP
jgi:YD repeat-containing protein